MIEVIRQYGILIVAALVWPRTVPNASAQEPFNTETAISVFANYCYDCHTGDEAEGGILVDFFEKGDSLERQVETVEKIIRVLKEQQMPPIDYAEMESQERVQLLDWIQNRLEEFDCGTVSRPGRVTMRRLNRIEYNNTIRDLTGLELSPADDFPSDDVGNGFDNIGDVLTIPPILLEKYLGAAADVAAAVVADEAALKRVFPFEPADPNDPEQALQAGRDSLKHFATRAFRRPITETEEQRLLQLVQAGFAEHGLSIERVKELAITAILSSPQFIYKVEADEPEDFVDGQRPLNDFEIATRLSYFLWSSMPDEQLLQSAMDGQLHTAAQIEEQVDRMLDDPKSQALIDNFVGQWLQLRDLENLSPDPQVFSEFDNDLKKAMRVETELLVKDILAENKSVLSLLDADYTFVNERLAAFYGLSGVEGDQFQRVALGGVRSGVLMHASILLITSNPTRTSPVKRGKWVLDNLLGEPPPPPPPNVPELESAETIGTLRQQMEQHRANPNCAVCHTKMDALGFGLENFDAVGKWRDSDGRNPVDSTGELPGGRKFDGPVEMVKILVEDKKEAFSRCLTEKMLTYALGRGLGVYDRCTVSTIIARTAGDDHRVRTLVKAIATSPPFMTQEAAE